MIPILIGLGALALAVVVYATLIERNWYAVRKHTVPCLPPGYEGIRIVSISDMHLLKRQRRKRRFLASLDRFEPDLVIGTGDYLGDAESVDATVRAMTAIKPRTAALFVLGSNDYWGPVPKNPLKYFMPRDPTKKPTGVENPWPQMVAGLEAAGWVLINNRTLDLDGIDVLGLDDAHVGRADLSLAKPRTDERFRLVVAHSPDVARPLSELGYDLIVCGHTHGGQVRIPGVGALVTNCELPRSMARGLHRMGDAWLFVNAGLGTNKFAPYRFACRPEVAVLDLVARA